jgi:predicted helicase
MVKGFPACSQHLLAAISRAASGSSQAWNYRLGSRSAIEWILDQYREKKSKDPIIRAKFDAYRFADHKEKVINLLQRVTRVSVETTEIFTAMQKEKR